MNLPQSTTIPRRAERPRPNLRPSLIVFGVLVIAVGLAVKYRWHERFLAPSVHAVRAAGGHVDLVQQAPDWVREFLGPDFLADATSLSLTNPSLSGAEVSRLVGKFPHLESLSVYNTQLADAGAVSLEHLSDLERLSLGSTKISDDALRHLSGCTKLKGLDLQKTEIDGSGLAAIASLAKLDRLSLDESLVKDESLSHIAGCRAVSYLSLARCPNIGDNGLRHLSGAPLLSTLDLSGTKVTSFGLKLLAGLPRLKYLRLVDTSIDDDSLAALSTLPLRSLDLQNNAVTDRGLAHLKSMTALVGLDLSGTAITDEAFSTLQAMTGFGYLQLNNTQVADRTLEALSALPQLRNLSMAGTKISDESVSGVVGFSILEQIDLRGNGLSKGTVAEFHRNHPRVRVIVEASAQFDGL